MIIKETLNVPGVPVIPSLEKIEKLRGLSPALDFATALVIRDDETSLSAQSFVQACNTHIANVEGFFEDGKRASDKLHKWFTTAVASLTKSAREAKAIAGGKVYNYQQAERQRIARIEAEAREAARKLAEEAALKEAEELTAMGATAEADRVMGREIVVETPLIYTPPVAKVEGSSTRENWQAEGTDLMATVKAVAAGTVPLEALTWNTAWLGQRAKQMKGDTKIPGVRVWDKGTFVAGRTA